MQPRHGKESACSKPLDTALTGVGQDGEVCEMVLSFDSMVKLMMPQAQGRIDSEVVGSAVLSHGARLLACFQFAFLFINLFLCTRWYIHAWTGTMATQQAVCLQGAPGLMSGPVIC
jgi:hypothetical protein